MKGLPEAELDAAIRRALANVVADQKPLPSGYWARVAEEKARAERVSFVVGLLYADAITRSDTAECAK